ncbi:hypothetical protein ACHAXR_008113, partial [Thalassiosira sp. AJA248-18]
AACEESRQFQRAIELGNKEISKLEEENKRVKGELKKKTEEKKFFMEISRDQQKRIECLESARKELKVQKKEEQEELSDDQIASFENLPSYHFSTMKQLIGGLKDVPIAVSSETGKSGFSLQYFFDSLYSKKGGDSRAVLFGGEKDGSNRITKLIFSEWKIVYDKQEVYAYKLKKDAQAQKKEDTGVDEGGPSRQFLTDVFKQLGALTIKVGAESVSLFENTDSGVQVMTDEILNDRIKRAAKKCSGKYEEIIEDSIKCAKDYVRAIGRIILHSIVHRHTAHKLTLPSNAMPPFFMNVLFHGYNNNYHRDDILNHINMLGIGAKSTLEWLVDGDSGEKDENDNEWTPDTFFEKYIPNNFIRSRKILLGSLQDGLTFGCKPELLDELEKGSSLSNIFSMLPLEAIQKIYFAKPKINVDDLLGVLVPKYGEGEPHPSYNMTEEDKERLAQAQQQFFERNFKKYLQESAKEDETFLVKFVECATGSNYLPYDNEFKINIEFNFSLNPVGYPVFHACTGDVVIPGYEACFSDYESFKREKMNFAIGEVFNKFDMK